MAQNSSRASRVPKSLLQDFPFSLSVTFGHSLLPPTSEDEDKFNSEHGYIHSHLDEGPPPWVLQPGEHAITRILLGRLKNVQWQTMLFSTPGSIKTIKTLIVEFLATIPAVFQHLEVDAQMAIIFQHAHFLDSFDLVCHQCLDLKRYQAIGLVEIMDGSTFSANSDSRRELLRVYSTMFHLDRLFAALIFWVNRDEWFRHLTDVCAHYERDEAKLLEVHQVYRTTTNLPPNTVAAACVDIVAWRSHLQILEEEIEGSKVDVPTIHGYDPAALHMLAFAYFHEKESRKHLVAANVFRFVWATMTHLGHVPVSCSLFWISTRLLTSLLGETTAG